MTPPNNNKKAQIQISFNWIFVLIVGSIFLIFFFTMIGSQKESSNLKTSASLAKYFDTIISTTAQKEGVLKDYEFGTTLDVTFECKIDPAESYYAFKRQKIDDTKFLALFAPRHLDGELIYTWTQRWNFPYNIMTMLYITNDQHYYLLWNGTQNYQEKTFVVDFPKNITMTTINSREKPSKFSRYEDYTYVFFLSGADTAEDGWELSDMYSPTVPMDALYLQDYILDKPGKLLLIDSAYQNQNDFYSFGKVYFVDLESFHEYYMGPGDGGIRQLALDAKLSDDFHPDLIYEDTFYLGKASLMGAIFSDDVEYYECNMAKALKQYKMLTLLQHYKSTAVLPRVPQGTVCHAELTDATNDLSGEFKQIVTHVDLLLADYKYTTAQSLYVQVDTLKDKNDLIAYDNICAVIY